MAISVNKYTCFIILIVVDHAIETVTYSVSRVTEIDCAANDDWAIETEIWTEICRVFCRAI